jgi:hypothetical protein
MKISILGAGNVGGTLGTRLGAQGSRCLLWRSPCRRCRDAGTSANHWIKGPRWNRGRSGRGRRCDCAGDTVAVTRDASRRQSRGQGGGGLHHPLKPDFTGLALGYTASGAEQVAEWATGAKVFKGFNQTGFNIMADPAFDGERAVMFVCGDDDTLSADIGFQAIDAGSHVIARLLEPYGMLWIHLALARGLGRDFAFVLHRRE